MQYKLNYWLALFFFFKHSAILFEQKLPQVIWASEMLRSLKQGKKNKAKQTTKLLNLIQIILLLRRHATSPLHNHVHQQTVLKPPSSFRYQRPIPSSRKERRFFFFFLPAAECQNIDFSDTWSFQIPACLQHSDMYVFFITKWSWIWDLPTCQNWCTGYSHQRLIMIL